MGDLLLEIGTEEIPSGYLEGGLEGFRGLAESSLRDNRIKIQADLTTYGTPRRLVLVGRAIADKQEDTIYEMTGPPKNVAFDEKGSPTKAALGFARRQGVSVHELQVLETPKGEYLYIKRRAPGRATIEILSEVLPDVIAHIPWPKSMRWASGGFSFVRPIHWILALFSGEIIPFEVAGVRSGNRTKGHRFMSPQAIEVKDLEGYMRTMKECSVMIDQGERRREVEKAVSAAAGTVSGISEEDPELLSTVTNMVEFPFPICGGFDDAFLDLPDAVLITAMKEHQRYFPVRDRHGQLLPNFVAVNNTVPRDESTVRKGHEKVLRARLADAGFFFQEDRKRPLQNRLEDLKTVIYQAELGTAFAKVQRFTELAEYLTERIALENMDDVRLVASLCKCDLVTEMVMEFPSLQGTIGEIYARLDGHPEDVCRAISDHYLPLQADGKLPASLIGSIVALADRMDTIVGCFAIGVEPTGTADPYALRRHALAIIRIMKDNERIAVSLSDFVRKAASILNETIRFHVDETVGKVIHFVKDRLRNMLVSGGLGQELVDSVIAADFRFLHQVEPRALALHRFRDYSRDFEALATASKRIMNIVKGFEGTNRVDPELFENRSEENLWETFQAVKGEVKKDMDGGNYFEALTKMTRLSGPIDDFFSQIMVMAEDKRLRENRLDMLREVKDLFLQVADFSKFTL